MKPQALSDTRIDNACLSERIDYGIIEKRAKEFETHYPVTKAITKGDALTKLSMLVMGLGNLAHKQIVRVFCFWQ